MSRKSKEGRRVRRVKLESGIKVVICSIGARTKYDLSTRDISSTGFFLEYESPSRFPYGPSSILETWLWIDSDRAIFFNGKMARVVYPKEGEDDRAGIGIKIVQIDEKNATLLAEFIEDKGMDLMANKVVVA